MAWSISRHICLAYDGYKDLYKLFVDGIKITSGSWTGDKSLEPVRFSPIFLYVSGVARDISKFVKHLAQDDLPKLKNKIEAGWIQGYPKKDETVKTT